MRVLEYRPRGAAEELWYCHEPEVCMAGPANTGKTRAWCERVVYKAETYPGYRCLITRLARAHLTESAVRTMEDLVLWPGHPALRGAARANRRAYTFPNGSSIVLGGLDEPTKWYSTEWDDVVVNEVTELALDQYERFHRALRNKHVPHPLGGTDPITGAPRFLHQLISDCNPDAPTHWMRQRMDTGRCYELKCRHSDNPTFGAGDQAALDALTGVRRARLRDGLWVAAEGQIWELYEPGLGGHLVDDVPRDSAGREIFEFVVFSQDWGFRKPGCLQVWGVMANGDMYLIREWYRQGKAIDWWVSVALEANRQYSPVKCICDPEDQGSIDLYRRAGIPAVDADKRDKRAGLGQVADRMMKRRNGKPRIFFLRTALVEKDPELAAKYQPTCTVEEIPAYVWRRTKDGQVEKEEPDPLCVDHGCDATRYAVRFVDKQHPSAAIVRSDEYDQGGRGKGGGQGAGGSGEQEVPYEYQVLGRTRDADGGSSPAIRWPWS